MERLDLCRNALQSIPAEIVQLPMLRNVNLSHNQLRSLPECPWGNTLSFLNVGENNLSSLPNGLSNAKLNSLNIKHNLFTEVREIPLDYVSVMSWTLVVEGHSSLHVCIIKLLPWTKKKPCC